MGYIMIIYLLDWVYFDILVVNDLFWVWNYFEKLLVLDFFDLILLIIIVCDFEMLKEFCVKYGDVIFKLLYGNGGVGVFKLKEGDSNFVLLYELFSGINCEFLIV